MAMMNFMEIADAPGDSQNSAHPNTIDIEPFSISASNGGSYAVGSGGGAAGASHDDMHITALLDKGFPVLFNKCAQGDIVSEIKFFACKMVGKIQVDFVKVTLKKVQVTAVDISSSSGSTDGLPTVSYGFAYQEITTEYTPVDENGKVGAVATVGWNVAKNTKV